MNKPDGRAMVIKLWELYARRNGVELGLRFEGEDEIKYINKSKNRTDAEREKIFYERIEEYERRNAQSKS